MRKREGAREDFDKAREGSDKEALGRCAGSCTRAGNADGVAGHLGMFISNIGGEDINDRFTRMAKCGGQGTDEKQKLFESFRELLTNACTAMDGEWKGYTIGSGHFVDQGSWGDWGMGQCK